MTGSGGALPPGRVIVILGGGQLGRYLVWAGQRAGYRMWVVDPAPDAPAGRAADRHFATAWDDPETLDRIDAEASVITAEFENIPAAMIERFAGDPRLRPGAKALLTAQDRVAEKRFLTALGLPVAPWSRVSPGAPVEPVPYPAILKTARLGYDGRGQQRVDCDADVPAALATLGSVECVLEQRLDLCVEASVVVARDIAGDVRVYSPIENEHRDGILHRSLWPAMHPRLRDVALAESLIDAATRIADALDYIGVLAVEFFVVVDSESGSRWFVNEVAPRPHNSGHVTLDGTDCSQFDLQLAAIVGATLPRPRPAAPTVLYNLLGDSWSAGVDAEPWFDPLLAEPSARLHWYGKNGRRAGRKMGHVAFVAAGDVAPVAEVEATASLLDRADRIMQTTLNGEREPAHDRTSGAKPA